MKTLAFASAAHEFRNPLNSVINSLELLEDKIDNDRGQTFLKIAKSCSNLMLSYINDILDFSQIEAKKIILNLSPTEIEVIIQDTFDVLGF